MDNEVLILVLALSTFALVVAAAAFMRVAKAKGDSARSAFVEGHGGTPLENRPGTEH